VPDLGEEENTLTLRRDEGYFCIGKEENKGGKKARVMHINEGRMNGIFICIICR